MRRSGLQTLIVFALGLICGFFVKCSFWSFIALILALLSVFVYTTRDAQGLKHNQDKYFTVISAALYLAALLISIYAIIAIIPFMLYEMLNGKSFKAASLRLLPIHIISQLVMLKYFFLK
jgi:hypothetical protein